MTDDMWFIREYCRFSVVAVPVVVEKSQPREEEERLLFPVHS